MTTPDPNEDTIEFELYDTDFDTRLAILPASNASVYLELNEPGSGNLSVPSGTVSAPRITSGRYIQALYRGAARGGLLVENVNETYASSGEGADKWTTVSGRGALALLEDAIVWDVGTAETTRDFTGTMANTLITLIDEAKARGALANVTYDFTSTADSNSVAWTDSEDLSYSAGTSLLEVLREIASYGIDFDMQPDGAGNFVLSAYKGGLGSDKSSTIYFRVGMNCQEVTSTEEGTGIKNVVRIQYATGFTTVKNDASITARRRREMLLDAKYAPTSKTAVTAGNAKLNAEKAPRQMITVNVYDGVHPRAFVDYSLGDTITLDREGTQTTYRIRGIELSWDDNEKANVTLDLNDLITEHEIRMQQQINALARRATSTTDSASINTGLWIPLGKADNDGQINALLVSGSLVYIGGSFTKIGGATARGVAYFDTADNSFHAVGDDSSLPDRIGGGSPICHSLCFVGANLYAGFETDPGDVPIWKWNGSAWSYQAGGLSGTIYALATDGSVLFYGGSFTQSAGTHSIGVYTGSSYNLLDNPHPPDDGEVRALYYNGTYLFAGGSFTVLRNTAYAGIAKCSYVNPTNFTWTAVSTGITGGSATVYSIVPYNNNIVFGGSFTTAGGVACANIASWDGSAFTAFAGSPDGIIRAMVANDEDLYVAGIFTDDGDINIFNNCAIWTQGEWLGMGQTDNRGLDNDVYSICQIEGIIGLGGVFTASNDGKASKYAIGFIRKLDDALNYLSSSGAGGSFNLAAAIHGATSKTTPADNDETAITDSAANYALKKLTWANIKATLKTYFDTLYPVEVVTHAATSKATPVDADEIPLVDSAASWGLKKLTWANVKATLKTYFDTLYATSGSGVPGGVDTNVQYNDGGAFGGDANFAWDKTSRILTITGTGAARSRITGVADGSPLGGIDIRGGEAGGDYAGGNVGIFGGTGGATAGIGGSVELLGGFSQADSANGGDIYLTSGSAGGTGSLPGDVYIEGGISIVSGVRGFVYIHNARFENPAREYVETKANIEALTGVAEGSAAYAIDTNDPGWYDGTAWVWGSGVPISDTEANILASTENAGTFAVATDTLYIFVSVGGGVWYKFPFKVVLESASPDMGAEDDSSKIGYGVDYISDKRISNSSIGGNATTDEGAIRVVSGVFQVYLSGAWTDLYELFLRDDDTFGYVVEHTPLGFDDEIEVMSGNSVSNLGLNGLPLTRQYKMSMGAYGTPLIIDGGTF